MPSEHSRPTWDDTFFKLCEVISTRSKDQNTKVGCVIVGPNNEIRTMGYNCFPRGINDNVASRQVQPEKYSWFEHSERNAIYNAARVGIPLEGCSLYVPWVPCCDCARAIIQSGIKEVIIPTVEVPIHWAKSCGTSVKLFFEADIKMRLQNNDYIDRGELMSRLDNLAKANEVAHATVRKD